MATYPTQTLKPGTTSDSVKQLQEYLISKGYSISSATGYYGEQTKTAVAKLQSDLGVDTAGSPGYWGPKTVAKLGSTSQPKIAIDANGNAVTNPITSSQTNVGQRGSISTTKTQQGSTSTPQEGDMRTNSSGKSEIYSFNPDTGETFWREITPEERKFQENPSTPSNWSPVVNPNIESPNPNNSNLPPELATLLTTMGDYLADLKKRGQVINPTVEITPEKLADFMSQAEREIDPYYATQLKTAREDLLRGLGYTSDELLRYEQDQEVKYGRSLKDLASTMAEAGLARSGRRLEGEQQLAQDTGTAIASARAKTKYTGETAMAGFAKQYGGTELPSLQNMATIGSAPRVLPGIAQFQSTQSTSPFYNLSSSLYDGLIGSDQYQSQTDKKRRASELEAAYRTQEETKAQRQLL